MKLTVELDGQQVPLTDCDWVLREPCGCPESITLAVSRTRTLASEDEVWTYFYRPEFSQQRLRDRKIREAKAAGWSVGLMRRSEAVDALMKPCPHRGGGSRG